MKIAKKGRLSRQASGAVASPTQSTTNAGVKREIDGKDTVETTSVDAAAGEGVLHKDLRWGILKNPREKGLEFPERGVTT